MVLHAPTSGAPMAWSDLPRTPRSLRRGHRAPVDPFSALEVQLALARLEALVEQLQRDDGRFARAHHLHAARAAYDQALDEACRLAGVTALPEGGALRRILAEAELRTRGWSW